eukprot:symbB.v1.2.029546.t1/scaffold3246.1/size60379/2
MILTAAFQFAMGFVAIMLRYGERGYFQPLVEGVKKCFSRIFWLATCCLCRPCAECFRCCRCLCPRFHRPEPPDDRAEVPDALEESQVESSSSSSGQEKEPIQPLQPRFLDGPILRSIQRLLLKAIRVPSLLAHSFRWYWFHLAGQAGFIVREIFVIQTLDGWYWEVCAANLAMWMVARQIWQFSKVRAQSPKAVDQILDMLLLPINYGFLCALCVRILKLENTGQNRTIVSAMIDSADIWEAWALWSVLRLFVRIVDKGSERMVERENDFRLTVRNRGVDLSILMSRDRDNPQEAHEKSAQTLRVNKTWRGDTAPHLDLERLYDDFPEGSTPETSLKAEERSNSQVLESEQLPGELYQEELVFFLPCWAG